MLGRSVSEWPLWLFLIVMSAAIGGLSLLGAEVLCLFIGV